MKRRWVLTVATVAIVALSQSSAQAAIITQQGTPSSLNSSANQPFININTRDCASLTRGRTFVVFNGDYIVVEDQCADGRGVMGEVVYKANGIVEKRQCQNVTGVGTKVQCNFDWPENITTAPKALNAYVRAATGSAWELAGTTSWIVDG